MPFNPNLYNEKYRIPSIRAKWWEYGGGIYHVTIKTQNAIHYFGHIIRNSQTRQNEMIFSELGEYVNETISKISDHQWYANIPNWVVMPNHVHMIVIIDGRGCKTDKCQNERNIPADDGGNDGFNNNNNPCRVPWNVSTKCLVDPSPDVDVTVALPSPDVGASHANGTLPTKCLVDPSPDVDVTVALPSPTVGASPANGTLPTKCSVNQLPNDNASPTTDASPSPTIGVSPNDNVLPTTAPSNNDHRPSELMSSISPKTGSLSLVIRQFKQSVTKYAKQHDIPFPWQSRFYESVITKQYEFDRVWRYIDNNVAKWISYNNHSL